MTSVPLTTPQLERLRSHFPYLGEKAYFNYGGQGPMASRAIAATTHAQDYVQKVGPFSGAVNGWLSQEASQTRGAIAQELGTTPDTITLTEDVSVGCNIALWGIDWQPGDRLLMTDCEHQGIIAAVQELQRRFGLEVSICPILDTLNSGDPVAVIQQHLTPKTRLVVLSHILWNTGQVLPLADIVKVCHGFPAREQIRVLVDAAQSVGVLPLNLTTLGADFYAFTGHKWWCGPAGGGGLYVRPQARDNLSPTFIGWRSIMTNAVGDPVSYHSDGRRYEIATSAVPLYAGLREAIALHAQFATAEERYRLICDRSAYLWQRLTDLPTITCLKTSPPEAGLVSFQTNSGKHQSLVQYLEEKKCFVRTILNPNCVRACVHYFTTDSEIDSLVEFISMSLTS
ncbi:aminotransferase class V-fold PLP-dependent enzyme [Myxacorys almedinensis]|uniref:Aminotransferase class V-fold PLP-dependent enzyme n=1 Tax=Myxacorys almedinensis A TaxID=2690445 RepID=A0A8J8CKG9_9CYAN|nr:aminotransferase class V-fold PLP-dependent enzyme [Myxacorys almedinensis]NDJ18606.1 aminotransferase class V-fold PLP-dependent enzyme [Myxacorys almedinensis A]